MYRHFFGLHKHPFNLVADVDLLYLTPQHREALASLSYAILARKGFAVLVSDPGMGKSTLLATLRNELKARPVQISATPNPVLNPSEFLEMTLLDFGHTEIPKSKAKRVCLFRQTLVNNHAKGKLSVLMIDEAHKLSPEVLEEIRLLSNFEMTQEKLIQIVLAGQKELERTLDLAELWQLKQRIPLWASIRPLTTEEVQQYIQHRWTQAGGKDGHPFEPNAVTGIAELSSGIPRLINSICDVSLMLAFTDGERRIQLGYVIDASRDLRLQTGAKANTRSAEREQESKGPMFSGAVFAPGSPVTTPIQRQARGSQTSGPNDQHAVPFWTRFFRTGGGRAGNSGSIRRAESEVVNGS
jgi:general secretion pathway protein A